MIGQPSFLSDPLVAPAAPPELRAPVRPALRTTRGSCRPFGATPLNGGVNFALFARHATSVHLVLFKEGHDEPFAELPLDSVRHKTGDVWHIFVQDLKPDTLYGYRVNGPFNPRQGHRYNPRAIVIDPYARALSGGHPWGATSRPARRLGRILFEDDFDWEGDVPLNTPLAQSIVYELHVRGFTRDPSSGVAHPGTYLGLAEKIPYLKSLGITAVELMPILEFDELDAHSKHPLSGERLRNYWGYSQLSYFALKSGFAVEAGRQVREFKETIKAFHRAGIEVILDVVYNHTAEGNENGPILSFRGLDNLIYYMLDREGRYYNFSGCGNTLNCNHPVVRDLILDSLTYLVSELHVDGFRFDLAAILGRGPEGKVLDDPPLIRHIAEHPLLAGTKLIAEAWDAAGLSQVGKFPGWGRWAEMNGWFRDDARRFLRSEPHATAAVARRIAGSLDLYGSSPSATPNSINFVTCHDGFTLHDLVSYNHKHNWANGENDRDGWNENLSYNCGHEGPTDNAAVNALRQQQMRNFLAMLFVSQGVPFLLMGDEFGRTQYGNNNAYCQDNEISWVDWNLARKQGGLLRFTQLTIALRKKYFMLNREDFVNRVIWHGARLGDPDWTGLSRALAFHLRAANGQPNLYVMFNAHWEWQRFALPHCGWRRLVDTHLPSPQDIVEEKDAVPLHPGDHYNMAPRSAVVLLG